MRYLGQYPQYVNYAPRRHGYGWVKYVVLLLAAMFVIVTLTPSQIASNSKPCNYRFMADMQPSASVEYEVSSRRNRAPAYPHAPSGRGRLFTRTKTKDRRKVGLALQKIVAARQLWRCAHCNKMLPSTFQTDHRIPLYTDQEGRHTEYLNSAANLDCLCNDCHAAKTQRESIQYKDLLQSLRRRWL